MLINYENIYINLTYSALYLIIGFLGGLVYFFHIKNKEPELQEKPFSSLFSSTFIGLIGGYLGQALFDNLLLSIVFSAVFGIIRFSALNIIVAVIIKKMGIDVDKVKETRKFINYTNDNKNESYERILSNLIANEHISEKELLHLDHKKYLDKINKLIENDVITGVQYDILKTSMYNVLKDFKNKNK